MRHIYDSDTIFEFTLCPCKTCKIIPTLTKKSPFFSHRIFILHCSPICKPVSAKDLGYQSLLNLFIQWNENNHLEAKS